MTDKNERDEEMDERDEDERKRDKDKDVLAGTVGQLPLPPVDDRRPPRRGRDRDQPPEVVQDFLEVSCCKPGRRAFRTDVNFDNEKRGVYEMVDWAEASIDGKVRSVRLKPIEGTKGQTEWVSAQFVRVEQGGA